MTINMKKRSQMYGTANERGLDDSIFPPAIQSAGIFFKREPKRYGDNPHQACCLYVPTDDVIEDGVAVPLGRAIYGDKPIKLVVGGAKEVKTGKGGLSMTNTRDIDGALKILKYFREADACAAMKHINPSGLSVAGAVNTEYIPRTLNECFTDAWNGDPRAAFGSAVVFTQPVDKPTAEAIQDREHYVEVVAAPGYDEGVMDVFENTTNEKGKKVNPRLRVVEVPNIDSLPRYIEDGYDHLSMVMNSDGSFFLQEPYLTKVRTLDDVEVVTKRKPTAREWEDLRLNWYVVQEIRSNAVTIGKNGQVLAAGTGKQDRVDAIDDTIRKAKRYGHDINGAVIASDGFMTFADNIKPLLEEGVSAVIQPGGSMRDDDVIEACGDKIAMVFTGERCFSH